MNTFKIIIVLSDYTERIFNVKFFQPVYGELDLCFETSVLTEEEISFLKDLGNYRECTGYSYIKPKEGILHSITVKI